MTPSLVVTADDATGALETAALLADAGWRAGVVTGDRRPWAATVVDLRSRHLPAVEAAARLRAVLSSSDVRAHKLDSTLRGAWPEELSAAVGAGRRVVLVPVNPLAGRTCVGGVVRVDGVDLRSTAFATDPRSPVRTDRPSTLLPGATELGGPNELSRWLLGSGAVAVVDAASMAHLDEVAALVLGRVDVLLAGPAPAVAALGRTSDPRDHVPAAPVVVSPPVVVVCGSAHPTSQQQVDHLARHHPTVTVVGPPREPGADPGSVLAALATRARRVIGAVDPRTVVLVGGDTTGAVLGVVDVEVVGSLGVGVACGRALLEGVERTVVSKPGGFGDEALLTRVLDEVRA